MFYMNKHLKDILLNAKQSLNASKQAKKFNLN